jgi:hypothetical protein
MPAQEQPLIDIDLGQNGGKTVFWNIDEIEKWFRNEYAFWTWSNGITNTNEAVNQARNKINQVLNHQFRNYLTNLRQTPTPENTKNQIRNIENLIKEAYLTGNNLIPYSSTPIALFIEDRKKYNPLVACYILADFMKFDTGQNPPLYHAFVQGIIEAIMFKKGFTSNIDLEKKSLSELFQENKSVLKNHKAAVQTFTGDAENQLTTIQQSKTKMDTDFKVLLSDAKNSLEGQI